jgi:hypothetical protein
MLKAIAEDQDCVETIVEGGSRSKCIAGGGVEGCIRSQGESDCGAGGKGRVEAEGYKPVESRAISEGYSRRGAVRRMLSGYKNSAAKDTTGSDEVTEAPVKFATETAEQELRLRLQWLG